MLYRTVLVSAEHQHESAIDIHMSPPSSFFFTYNISICLCCCYNFSAKTPCSYSSFLFIFSINTLICLHDYFLKTIFCSGAVLGLQHNREECTEISNIPLYPKPWRASLITSTLTRVVHLISLVNLH